MSSYEEYLKQRKDTNSVFAKLSGKIKPLHILLIGMFFFIGNMLYKSKENNFMIILFVLLFVVWIISLMKAPSEKKLIPRAIAQKIAHDDLLTEIGPENTYTTGTTIFPSNRCFLQHFDDGSDGMVPFKWNFGFLVKEPGKPPVDVIYKMHPYTGEGKGVVETYTGFDEDSAKDIKLVFPETISKEVKKD